GAAGRLTINGNFTQTASGAINVELGGQAGGQFDQLVISGTANLGGTLNVTRLAGFTPPTGSGLAGITFGSRTGPLHTNTRLHQGDSQLNSQYNDNDFSLTGLSPGEGGEDPLVPRERRPGGPPRKEAEGVAAAVERPAAPAPAAPDPWALAEALAARAAVRPF